MALLTCIDFSRVKAINQAPLFNCGLLHIFFKKMNVWIYTQAGRPVSPGIDLLQASPSIMVPERSGIHQSTATRIQQQAGCVCQVSLVKGKLMRPRSDSAASIIKQAKKNCLNIGLGISLPQSFLPYCATERSSRSGGQEMLPRATLQSGVGALSTAGELMLSCSLK